MRGGLGTAAVVPRSWEIAPLSDQTVGLQGYLAHKKPPPPQDHHRALGVGLLLGPRESRFLMSEVLFTTDLWVS